MEKNENNDARYERERGKESDMVLMFDCCLRAGVKFEDRIPINGLDTVVYEMALRFGRADIVIFHIDGSCSVIEAKDGSRGYNHVVSGIGQAGLYSTQISIRNPSLKKVRKCLLWTSTGNTELDAVIEVNCIESNTVPLPWPDLKDLMEAAFFGSDLRRKKCQG